MCEHYMWSLPPSLSINLLSPGSLSYLLYCSTGSKCQLEALTQIRRANPLFWSAAVTVWTLRQGLGVHMRMTYTLSIDTSLPDPEEHDVPLPESLSSCDASLDAQRLSCFVSSLESKQNIIFNFETKYHFPFIHSWNVSLTSNYWLGSQSPESVSSPPAEVPCAPS